MFNIFSWLNLADYFEAKKSINVYKKYMSQENFDKLVNDGSQSAKRLKLKLEKTKYDETCYCELACQVISAPFCENCDKHVKS